MEKKVADVIIRGRKRMGGGKIEENPGGGTVSVEKQKGATRLPGGKEAS